MQLSLLIYITNFFFVDNDFSTFLFDVKIKDSNKIWLGKCRKHFYNVASRYPDHVRGRGEYYSIILRYLVLFYYGVSTNEERNFLCMSFLG